MLLDPPSASEDIQNIKKIALRGSELVRELMIYAGQETGTFEVLDLAELISEMLELIRLSVSKHARIETDFAVNLPSIHANPAQMRQVIMNLAINASEAIGDTEGTIGLVTRRNGDFVQLQVSDTGHGMDPKTQRRVFDPFFTTKYAGRGLGLAVVQTVVRNHAGTIDIQSAPGLGMTFSLNFPRAVACPVPGPTVAIERRNATRQKVGAAVLLVEDEPTILLSVSRMLCRRGFITLEAPDGEAAIRLLEDRKHRISVMLLDMTIPGKSSKEVSTQARILRPDIKIFLTTAYSREVAETSANWPRVDGFLRKPYDIDSLVHLIMQALNAPECAFPVS